MNKAILFNFTVDKANHQIKVERSFNAPLDMVWDAWTTAEILDQIGMKEGLTATLEKLDTLLLTLKK